MNKKFFLIIALIALAIFVTACGDDGSVPPSAPAPTVVPPAAGVAPTAPAGPAAPAATCVNPSVISPEKDWKRVVWDCSNRIWQDLLPPETARPAFDSSFTAPFGGAAVFNGVNATLMYDPGKTGTPTVTVASKGNNIPITLVEGGWYKVKNGDTNGGF